VRAIFALYLEHRALGFGKVQAFLDEVAADLNAGILTQAQADALSYWGNILLLSVTRR
jgi:hypothetical protein